MDLSHMKNTPRERFSNIFRLGIKELYGFSHDYLLVALVLYIFTCAVYIAATAMPDSLKRAVIAIVDEDNTQLSRQISDSFLAPMFKKVPNIDRVQIDPGMDRGEYTFVVVIPSNFERDVNAGYSPALQLNIDATRMSQAFTGGGYIQQILQNELQHYLNRAAPAAKPAARVVPRSRYNPNLTASWFGSITELINNITMLAIILTGAALIRERERGTLEHLLVMPVTAFEIMVAKIWSMMLVVLVAVTLSLGLIVRGVLAVPLQGALPLFFAGVALHLFAVTSMGIFLATIAKNMPQLGILILLVLLPMEILSGGTTPQESMPLVVRSVMKFAPTTHFVEFSQQILFRGAGIGAVWESFFWLLCIGSVLFFIAWRRFASTLG